MKKIGLFISILLIALTGCRDSSDVEYRLGIGDVEGRNYVVVIGDSISEGHPGRHGRLHPSDEGGFNISHVAESGQLDYELSRIFGIPFINQGIAGQTSAHIKQRWNRDVLGQNEDIGDGRGSQTMNFANDVPIAVFLHVGINDIFFGNDLSAMKDNFKYFVQNSLDYDIQLFVSNLGGDNEYDEEKELKARKFNQWLVTEFSDEYPTVIIIDYLNWSTERTGDYRYLKAGMFYDSVHPNKSGYSDFANYAAEIIRPFIITNSK